MKLATTLLGLLLVTACLGQNTSKSELTTAQSSTTKGVSVSSPTAQVNRSESDGNYTYQFVSNRVMSVERASRYEVRFPTVYTSIVNISIDPNTQQVEIVLPNSHLDSELEDMINRFGYDGYQIAN